MQIQQQRMEGSLDAALEVIADRVAEKVFEKLAEINQPTQWLTMKQAAERTGIDYSSIAAAVRKGEILCCDPYRQEEDRRQRVGYVGEVNPY